MITIEVYSPGLPDGHELTISKKDILTGLELCENVEVLETMERCIEILQGRKINRDLLKVRLKVLIKEL